MAFTDHAGETSGWRVNSAGTGHPNTGVAGSGATTSQAEDGAFASLGMHHTSVRYLSWSGALLLSHLYALEQATLYRNEVEGISVVKECQQSAAPQSRTGLQKPTGSGASTTGTTTTGTVANNIFTNTGATGAGTSSSGSAATGAGGASNTLSASSAALACPGAVASVLIHIHEVSAAADAHTDPLTGAQTYGSIAEAFEAIFYPTRLVTSASAAAAAASAAATVTATNSGGAARSGRVPRSGATPGADSGHTTPHAALSDDLPQPSELREAFRLFLRLSRQCLLPALQLLLLRRRRRLGVAASSSSSSLSALESRREARRHTREHVDPDVHVHGFGHDDNGEPLFLDEAAGEQAASCVLQLMLGLAFNCPCASLSAAAQLVLAEALAHIGQDGFHLHSLRGFLRCLPELVRTSAGVAVGDLSTVSRATPAQRASAAAAAVASAANTRGPTLTTSGAGGAGRGPSSLPPLPHTSSTGAVVDADGPPGGSEVDERYLSALDAVVRHEQDCLRALAPPAVSNTTTTTTGHCERKLNGLSAVTTPATRHLRPDVDDLVWVDAAGRVHRQPMHLWLNARADGAAKETGVSSTPSPSPSPAPSPTSSTAVQVRTRALCAPLPATTVLSTMQRLLLSPASREVGVALPLRVAFEEVTEMSRSAHHNAVRRAQAVPGATKALRRKKMGLSTSLEAATKDGSHHHDSVIGSAGGGGASAASASATVPHLSRRQQLFRVLAQGHLFLTRPMRMSANELLFQTFAEGGECPGYYHLLALQPEVLKAHRDASYHLFAGEGPLTIDLRLMLAVMIASRHRCEYLVARYSALLMRYASMELQPQYEAPTLAPGTNADATGATSSGAVAGGGEGSGNSNNINSNNGTVPAGNAASATTKGSGESQAAVRSVYESVEDDEDAVSFLVFGDSERHAGGGGTNAGAGKRGEGPEDGQRVATNIGAASQGGGSTAVSGTTAAGAGYDGSRTASAARNGMAQPVQRSHPLMDDNGAVGGAGAGGGGYTASSPANPELTRAASAVKVKERWLTQGPPARLRAAQHLIALAAHTPWLVTETDVRVLLQQGWTVPELFQLMAIIAHVLPLCSFVMGLYVASEPWVSAVLPQSVTRRLQYGSVANHNGGDGEVARGWTQASSQADVTATATASRRVPVQPTRHPTQSQSRHRHHRHDDDQLDDDDDEDDDGDESTSTSSSSDEEEAGRDLYALYAGAEEIVSEQRIKGTATNHHALWRSQFNWFELGTTFMEQYYPGAAGLLNAEMDAVLDLSRRLSEVDCVGLKTGNYTPEYALRSLQLYVCNLLGYMTEDYPYNDINKVLRRPAKWFAQVLTVRPEILSRDDVVRWHGALSTAAAGGGGGGGSGGGGAGGGSLMTATSTSNNQSTVASATTTTTAAAPAVAQCLRRETELLSGAVNHLGGDGGGGPGGTGAPRDLSATRHAAGTRGSNSGTRRDTTTTTTTRSVGSGKTLLHSGMTRSASAEAGEKGAEGEEDGDDSAPFARQVEEAALLHDALTLQDERVLWLTALATMEARREGLLHILMHPLCSVLQNL